MFFDIEDRLQCHADAPEHRDIGAEPRARPLPPASSRALKMLSAAKATIDKTT